MKISITMVGLDAVASPAQVAGLQARVAARRAERRNEARAPRGQESKDADDPSAETAGGSTQRVRTIA